MNLKEIGRFNLCVGRKEYHKDYVFIILESRDKEKDLWDYWITIENKGYIMYILGSKDRDTAQGMWDYLCIDGLRYFIDGLNGYNYEED